MFLIAGLSTEGLRRGPAEPWHPGSAGRRPTASAVAAAPAALAGRSTPGEAMCTAGTRLPATAAWRTKKLPSGSVLMNSVP